MPRVVHPGQRPRHDAGEGGGPERRPRVVLVGPAVDSAGGIAVVIETLLRSSLNTRFELVHVPTYTDSNAVGKAMRAIVGIAHIAFLLGARRVDLVYLHTSSGFSLRRKAAVAALARLLRRPYVVHVHGSHFDAWFREAPAWERWVVRRTLERARLVVALSPSWAERLRAIVACRTIAIPNPVAIPDEPARLVASPPRIVSLGRLGARKGSRTIVRALALLADEYPDARLVLAGDGDLASVRDEAHRLGVNERVELPGWIGPDERARTLFGASVFVLPARDEGLPVALLEAMAYGLPVVVSPVGGIPDVFVDGRHGYFVPPDDPDDLAEKLRRLLGDLTAARAMGRQARKDAAASFAVDVVAAQIAQALERALADDFADATRQADSARSSGRS